MARPAAPSVLTASGVSENMAPFVASASPAALAASAAIFKPGRRANPSTDRNSIAKDWQVEAYRHVNICGEARYSATLFSAIAGRAEIGISEPNALARKAVWVKAGAEVDALTDLAPTVRERSKLIRDYMMHRTIAGECYLIARTRVDTDPGFIPPPVTEDGYQYSNWAEYLAATEPVDVLDPEYDNSVNDDPNTPIWEIVAVTEIQKVGNTWKVRHDNGNYLELAADDPVIRMWNPDPSDRREAWSPFRSLLPTLREIEWLTMHIFTQVRSRLQSAGVWFLPDNLTFPRPPADAIEGGEEAIALLNEAEQFMLSLAASGMSLLDADEVGFPTIVMSDAAALAAIDQSKLIKFWSEIDDAAMVLRSDAVRRFALGMDLPPEQVLGSSGLAVTGAGGSAGSVNHWGVWANEEQTISAHVEPALDDFVGTLTSAFLRTAVEGTILVIAYDTATLRLRQDRSKEAIELYDRGVLKATVMVRETGFDPENDMMDPEEHKIWLLNKIVGGSLAPEQIQGALIMLGVNLPGVVLPGSEAESAGVDEQPGRSLPPSLDDHPYEGPPRVDHEQHGAPFAAVVLSCEGLVLRALEKAGNRLLNDGKRGRDRDRSTPPHLAHLTASIARTVIWSEFDFSLAGVVLGDLPAAEMEQKIRQMGAFCADLYQSGEPYTRAALMEALS